MLILSCLVPYTRVYNFVLYLGTYFIKDFFEETLCMLFSNKKLFNLVQNDVKNNSNLLNYLLLAALKISRMKSTVTYKAAS